MVTAGIRVRLVTRMLYLFYPIWVEPPSISIATFELTHLYALWLVSCIALNHG